ncbi:MAG: hypothetical protein U9Q37_01685 [Euryarchaeota archaeon]|nr:hypothetical protein [Euryarchaeota archaeon]
MVENCYGYGRECKSGVLLREYALECARSAGADVRFNGNGIILFQKLFNLERKI